MSGKSKYPEQFRRDAVALARSSDRLLRQVARELGVNHETLRNRPRKVLGWKTPAEVFNEQLQLLQQPGVASTD
ncbi:transposase [Saccharothrix sp. MB29]|nr:transposase [Saccharothrix sp. MB29]